MSYALLCFRVLVEEIHDPGRAGSHYAQVIGLGNLEIARLQHGLYLAASPQFEFGKAFKWLCRPASAT